MAIKLIVSCSEAYQKKIFKISFINITALSVKEDIVLLGIRSSVCVENANAKDLMTFYYSICYC